jgi:hypothetical protein
MSRFTTTLVQWSRPFVAAAMEARTPWSSFGRVTIGRSGCRIV